MMMITAAMISWRAYFLMMVSLWALLIARISLSPKPAFEA
jgi:hypothetical protein